METEDDVLCQCGDFTLTVGDLERLRSLDIKQLFVSRESEVFCKMLHESVNDQKNSSLVMPIETVTAVVRHVFQEAFSEGETDLIVGARAVRLGCVLLLASFSTCSTLLASKAQKLLSS